MKLMLKGTKLMKRRCLKYNKTDEKNSEQILIKEKKKKRKKEMFKEKIFQFC